MKSGYKKTSDKKRAKQCEEKVKELEEKKEKKKPEKAVIYVSRTRENNKKYKGECSGVYFL